MKKVVFVGNTAWSMYNFRRVIFSRLINLGYVVYIISPFDKKYQKELESIGCKCLTINIDAKGVNPFVDLKLIIELKKIFSRISPDFCFFYTIKPNIYGSIVASFLNIPHIAITTGLGYTFFHNGIISLLSKCMYYFSLRKAKQVWFLNEDDKKEFLCHKLIKEGQAYVLKSEGIDLIHFSNDISFVEPGVSFILISRMLWDKGIGIYVDAARLLKTKYKNIEFRLLGFVGVDNPSAVPQEKIDQWVSEGVINYLGDTTDVRPFIAKSSCVVLPSFYGEGVPMCLLEGAAMSKPIITTDSVGCKDTVENDKTGYLCLPKDVQSLSCAMERIILMSESDRIKMGKAGRLKMEEEFDIELIVTQYSNILAHYIIN